MITYPVVEKFVSINGEGQKAGEIAAFIRMRGCNLACNYCDTSWANTKDCPCEFLSAEELITWLKEHSIENVTLTGGWQSAAHLSDRNLNLRQVICSSSLQCATSVLPVSCRISQKNTLKMGNYSY